MAARMAAVPGTRGWPPAPVLGGERSALHHLQTRSTTPLNRPDIMHRNTGWNEEMPCVWRPARRAELVWGQPSVNVLPLPAPVRFGNAGPRLGNAGPRPPSAHGSDRAAIFAARTQQQRLQQTRPRSAFSGRAEAERFLRRTPMVATLTTQEHATDARMVSMRAKPSLAGCQPHVQPKQWLVNVPERDPNWSEQAAREEAIRTLKRGVGICFSDEVRWHARPATSQVCLVGF